MLKLLVSIKAWLFGGDSLNDLKAESLSEDDRQFLNTKVAFYQGLKRPDKLKFERRCQEFIQCTEFVGHQLEVTQEDKLLVASGSVILAWG